jgi:hypothetical protein
MWPWKWEWWVSACGGTEQGTEKLEAYCRGGQGPPRAVVLLRRKEGSTIQNTNCFASWLISFHEFTDETPPPPLLTTSLRLIRTDKGCPIKTVPEHVLMCHDHPQEWTQSVSWLKKFFAGSSLRRTGFSPKSFRVEFLVDKVAKRHVYWNRLAQTFTCHYQPTSGLYLFVHPSPTLFNLRNRLRRWTTHENNTTLSSQALLAIELSDIN